MPLRHMNPRTDEVRGTNNNNKLEAGRPKIKVKMKLTEE